MEEEEETYKKEGLSYLGVVIHVIILNNETQPIHMSTVLRKRAILMRICEQNMLTCTTTLI